MAAPISDDDSNCKLYTVTRTDNIDTGNERIVRYSIFTDDPEGLIYRHPGAHIVWNFAKQQWEDTENHQVLEHHKNWWVSIPSKKTVKVVETKFKKNEACLIAWTGYDPL